MTMNSRITIDIDSWGDWRLRALRAYHGLARICDHVDVRVSSSGEGLHLAGWTEDELDLDQRLDIRRHLGDDANRIHMDAVRGEVGHTTGVLWTEKGDGEADADFEDIEAAIAHVSAGQGWGERLSEAVRAGHVV